MPTVRANGKQIKINKVSSRWMKAQVVYSYRLKSTFRGSLKQKQQRHNCLPLPFLCHAKVNMVALKISGTETGLEVLQPSTEQGRGIACSNLLHVQEAFENTPSATSVNYGTYNEHNISFAHHCQFFAEREVFMLLFVCCI